MKKLWKKVISLSLLAAVMLGLSLSAGAAVVPSPDAEIQASNYFVKTGATIMAMGNGKIAIEIVVKAKDVMTELGASKIYVYEKQTDGSYKQVYIYTRDSHAALIKKNNFTAAVQVTYQGTPGKYYYVTAACYAKNASGSETIWAGSNAVKAT